VSASAPLTKSNQFQNGFLLMLVFSLSCVVVILKRHVLPHQSMVQLDFATATLENQTLALKPAAPCPSC